MSTRLDCGHRYRAAMDLRTTGVWYFTETMSAGEAAEFAARIESLGYSTLWLPETLGRDPFAHIAHLSNHTSTLGFATGIANIYNRHPGVMKQAARTLAEQTGGRFLLGLGVSHAPLVESLRKMDASRPVATMRTYLEDMAASPATSPAPAEDARVVLAALGPRMLALAAELADGAHPYLTTPEHTAEARSILGPDKLLMVEQKVCLTTDAEAARAAAARAIGMGSSLPNYRSSWNRLGFSDDEIDSLAPRFVDAIVVWGNEDAVRAGVQAHYDAGATQVCIQPLHPDGTFGKPDWHLFEALAPANA